MGSRARIVAVVACIVTVGLVAAGMGAAAPKGRVVVALGSDTPTLDPQMHTARMGIIVGWHIYDSLYDREPRTGRPIPGLAESARAVAPTTWELKLRRNVRFHNGEPFDAESVKFTIERVLDPEQKSPNRGEFGWIKSVEVVDSHTARLHTHKPYPLVEERLASGNLGMLPPKYVREKGGAALAVNPVGTGPFRFVEWKKGDRLVLEANEQYWKPAPAMKTLVFRVIPETATQIAEILSGGVDIIRAVPPDQIPALEASPRVRVTTAKILRVVYLSMDAAGRASKTPVMDVRVRRAISHAVNVDEVMQKVLGGLAVRTNGAGMNPLAFGFDPEVKPYPFDADRAKKLLAEAGYPNGFEITMNTYAGSIVSVEQVSQAVQGYLGRVGIRARIKHFEDVGQYLAQLRAGKMEGTVLQSWGYGSMFDADALYYIFFKRGQPYDYGTTDDLSGLVEEARSTIDPTKRRELYTRAQRLIAEQAFWAPMYGQYAIEAASTKLDYEAASDEILRAFTATWKQ
ncbi:MAG: ABC transporter substrate-binding protein [Candidatus Rokuibacteriota bacterium]